MALHSKDEIREELLDDIYASADLSVVMPKYRMPERAGRIKSLANADTNASSTLHPVNSTAQLITPNPSLPLA